jgi:L-threonylcarbamoyladenylate synthase
MYTANELTVARQFLQQGKIVAMPTDTVYGLHCTPDHLPAIEKILLLKQRNADKGLILIADRLETFTPYMAPIPENIAQKIRLHPGITWLVPANKHVSPLITGQFDTIAIRICQQPFIAKLCALLGTPLISTSANISHHPVAKNIDEIKQMFPQGIDLIIEGDLPLDAVASEIREALTDKRIR